MNTPPELPILIITDHANLQYYCDPQKLSGQVHQWNAELADYNIKIIYKPGPSNHADALSWCPDHGGPTEMDEDIQVLPDTLFSLNTPKQQAIIANIGWSGVTDPEED